MTPFSLSSPGWNLLYKFEGPNRCSIVFLSSLALVVLGAIEPNTNKFGSATDVIGFTPIFYEMPSLT